MEDLYFVIGSLQDGTVSMLSFTKEELEEYLNSEDFGISTKVYTVDENGQFPSTNLRDNPGLYIIKGQMVVPKPKQVVTTWEI